MPREKGIPNKNGFHKYTKEEIEFLRENYPKFSLLELTKMFNEKFNCNIYYRTLSSAMKRKGIKSGRTGCFEKGCIPFNKGKKQTEYMTPEGIEQSSKTRFQKGKNINKQRHKYAEDDEEIEKEVKRSKAIEGTAKNIIENSKTMLEAQKVALEYGRYDDNASNRILIGRDEV